MHQAAHHWGRPGRPSVVPRLGSAIVAVLVGVAVASALLVLATAGQALAATPAPGTHVDQLTFDRAVDPASARMLEDAIRAAEGDGASALVVVLDTPGGDITSMHSMVEAELTSTVPIIVYVAPEGAHAGSGGTFLALAAPLVAMAPNTTIGAASPVDITGQDLGTTEKAKLTNDLVTLVDQLQQAYGRNMTAAAATVTQAAVFSATTATGNHLVNVDAGSLSGLLATVDSTRVTLGNGTMTTLHVAGEPVQLVQPTLANQIETVLLDPNVLFILFIVAAVCIYLELAHPGAIIPGTLGALALLLFLFGSQAITPNWAGLTLMLLGIVLLAADVRVPTHGVLSLGALASLALGSFIFFDTGVSGAGAPLSPFVIVGLVLGVGVIALLVLRYALRARHSRVRSGAAGLIGADATAIVPLAPEGRVRVLGEDWAARLDALTAVSGISVAQGQAVRVLSVDGLTLIVEPTVF